MNSLSYSFYRFLNNHFFKFTFQYYYDFLKYVCVIAVVFYIISFATGPGKMQFYIELMHIYEPASWLK